MSRFEYICRQFGVRAKVVEINLPENVKVWNTHSITNKHKHTHTHK